MKQSIYLVTATLTVGLMHAAAIEDTFRGIVIAATPASVCNSMILEGVMNTNRLAPAALQSPVGQLYLSLSENPDGINSLGQEPLVVDKTNAYSNTVQANQTLKDLTTWATQLVMCGAPEAERVMALCAFGSKYGRLLKKLVQTDIPDLKLRPTLKATIEKNNLCLNDEQTICFKAAQLAMGLNLQEQYDIDPTTFSVMFKRYLTSSSSSSSSTKTPTTTSNSTSGAGWWPW